MMEVKQRVANIVRFISMVAVLTALLFMYGYGTDDQVVRSFSEESFSQVSKSTIFYSGLAVFAIVNFLLMWGIKAYREVQGIYPQSRLFKSEFK